jgi:hypothetical protein
MYSENRNHWALHQLTDSNRGKTLTTEASKILIPADIVSTLDTRNPLEITPVEDAFFHHFCEAK